MLVLRSLQRGRARCRGAVAVFVVLLLFLLIGFAGLALDTALVRRTTQELQAAADAAALAAVQEVYTDDPATDFTRTRNAAMAIASSNEAHTSAVVIEANTSNAPTGDIVVGTWDRSTRIFTPTTSSPDAVQVTARRTSDSPGGSLGLVFGGAFGTGSSDLSRTAIAHLGTDTGPAVILVLDPARGRAFDVRGTAFIEAPSGRIQINSVHASQALYMNGAPNDPRVLAQEINVVGRSSFPPGSIVPEPIDGSDPVPDPLAGLPYPDPFSMTNYGGITGPGNYSPGYYPDGVDFNNGEANLAPGVYFFGSHGIELNGDAMMIGEEVMFFLDNGARVVIAGNSPGMDISAPSSGTYQGVSIFAHRDSALDFSISGSGIFEVRGTMYMALGHLEMDGIVDRRIGRIIINTQQLRGTGRYTITGEGPPEDIPLYPFLVR